MIVLEPCSTSVTQLAAMGDQSVRGHHAPCPSSFDPEGCWTSGSTSRWSWRRSSAEAWLLHRGRRTSFSQAELFESWFGNKIKRLRGNIWVELLESTGVCTKWGKEEGLIESD